MLRAIGATIPKFGPSRLICVHWKTFPPDAFILAIMGETTVETLRNEKLITVSQYEQWRIWKRICGLGAMQKRKCRRCEHVRRIAQDDKGLTVLTKLDGTGSVPVMDLTTAESLSRQRTRGRQGGR